MKFTTLLLSTTLILTLGACAKRPDSIAAVPMATSTYDRQSCRSLATEKAKVTAELNTLSAAQESAADSDALGVLLLGVPWSSMSGNDKEALIAVAKGRLDAINTVQAQKGCSS